MKKSRYGWDASKELEEMKGLIPLAGSRVIEDDTEEMKDVLKEVGKKKYMIVI